MKTIQFLCLFFALILVSTYCNLDKIEDGCSTKSSFSVTNNNCEAPCTLTFTNQSTGASSFAWDFGDGNSSTSESPDHLFNDAGAFSVRLTVTKNGCADDTTIVINISQPNTPKPHASFSIAQTGGIPSTVTIENNSLHSSSFSWDFGDAASGTNNNSTLENPEHTYTVFGEYAIKLTCTGPGGQDDTTIQVKIRQKTAKMLGFSPPPSTGNYLTKYNDGVLFTGSEKYGAYIIPSLRQIHTDYWYLTQFGLTIYPGSSSSLNLSGKPDYFPPDQFYFPLKIVYPNGTSLSNTYLNTGLMDVTLGFGATTFLDFGCNNFTSIFRVNGFVYGIGTVSTDQSVCKIVITKGPTEYSPGWMFSNSYLNNSPINEYAKTAFPTNDNLLVICGEVEDAGGKHDIKIWEVDPVDTSIKWEKTIGTSGQQDEIQYICKTLDNQYVICGSLNGVAFISKINVNTGQTTDLKTFPSNNFRFGAISVTHDNQIVASVMENYSSATETGCLKLYKLNLSNFSIQFTSEVDLECSFQAGDILEVDDFGFLITGTKNPATNSEAIIFKLDEKGNL